MVKRFGNKYLTLFNIENDWKINDLSFLKVASEVPMILYAIWLIYKRHLIEGYEKIEIL